MPRGTKAEKKAGGNKAHATKIALFGPQEPRRAAAQASWSKRNPKSARTDNPHIRERVYSPDVLERVGAARAWSKAHPSHALSDNPYSWYANKGEQRE